MNAIDELKAMLDERGVKHRDNVYSCNTQWKSLKDGAAYASQCKHDESLLELTAYTVTPQQAIDATLGAQDQPPYEDLIWVLRHDWDIEASWNEQWRFWRVDLTEEGKRKRDEADREHAITGETSDGYHTFNELYHHRAILFSVIVRDHPEIAWKARKHHDGSMYEGMFIVGVNTPQGQATYHYDLDPYWSMFECRELERAPEWDGHTPDDAIARIATLGREECEIEDAYGHYEYRCKECGAAFSVWDDYPNFCPNCRRKVKR